MIINSNNALFLDLSKNKALLGECLGCLYSVHQKEAIDSYA